MQKKKTNPATRRDYSRRDYVKARAVALRKARHNKRAAAALFSFA